MEKTKLATEDLDAVEFVQNPAAGKDVSKEQAAKNEATAEDITEHLLSLQEIESTLKTNYETGLSSEEAAMRLERDGPNRLTPPPVTPLWVKFMLHLFGGFAMLLWVGAVLCFIVYGINSDGQNLTLGIVLTAVVIITGIFSFYQEFKSDSVMAGFLKLSETEADVLRDGKYISINADQIVCGDVIKIEKGFKVSADMIVVASNGIKVDNSSLTGESEPQKRTNQKTDDLPFRTRNVVFFSTNCTEGVGKGVAVRTGDKTAIGQIAKFTTQGEKPDTLMKAEIKRFVHIISSIAVGLGVVFFILAAATGYEILDAAIFTIGIIVANVPEGLLATVTVALAITAQRMHSKNVLVKSTETVETLGSINAIASDKTGTLTQNRMTVRHAIFNSSKVNKIPAGRLDSTVAAPVSRRMSEEAIIQNAESTEKLEATRELSKVMASGEIHPNTATDFNVGLHAVNRATGKVRSTNQDLIDLVQCAGLCNHAEFHPEDSGKPILNRRTSSDPSEGALLKFAHSHASVYDLRTNFKEVGCIPFSSATKWMATIHEVQAGGHRVIIKGAPERVLERCAVHGANEPITPEIISEIEDANAEVAENGERVLAFAEFLLPDIPHGFEFQTDAQEGDGLNFPVEGMRFVGMLSLEDPPRDEVPPAVGCCHEAGITVIMVTGDHPLTARSIAGQVGILNPSAEGGLAPLYDMNMKPAERRDPSKNSVVVTGGELDDFDEDDWNYVLTRTDIVFARTLPHQKQSIVARLQANNMVVAVTGDGVNDAPALKKADVGIAMGTGSQVAQDAADMILMDDNFASIVKGIEEGRLIFANLKKSIAYTLTSNIPEITPFLMQIAFRVPLALTTIMILCIDLGTDMLPAISFAYEYSELDIMQQPPRDREKDKLVTMQLISWSYLQIGVVQAIASFTGFFIVFDRVGHFSISSLFADRQGNEWSDDTDAEDLAAIANGGQCKFINDNDRCVYHEERQDILSQAQTAYLVAIVIAQMANVIICKTRINSIVNHGFTNMVLNVGVLQETLLIVLLVYAPFLNMAFGTSPVDGMDWVTPVPFFVFLIVYDEVRKYILRIVGDKHWFWTYFYY
jgi:sodium/potassium-transporting ATPase subunit alpha